MERRKILIAGGDIRMLYAAFNLSDIYDVGIMGYSEEMLLGEGKEIFEKLKKTDGNADVLLLPPVVTDKSGKINAPFYKKTLEISEVIGKVKESGVLLMGIKGEEAKEAAARKNIWSYNYMKDETLALANAVPTAEAAIKIAIERTGRTIWNSRVLVTGFGRIGTILSDRLLKLGADVTAAARTEYARMKIKAMGAVPAKILPAKSYLSEMDIIFNTVPAEIFTFDDVMSLKKDCVFIELASAHGGVDKKAVKAIGNNYLCASGLPTNVIG